jgi:flagellar FliL protein
MVDEKAREAKEENKGETKEKKSKVRQRQIVIIVVFVALLGGGFFAWKSGVVAKLVGTPEGETKSLEPKKNQEMGPVYNLETFLVNLNEPQGKRYLKAKVTIELETEKVQIELERRIPQIRDAVLTMLSSKSYSDISDLTGKYRLRADLISMINSYLKTGKIANVYFTEFIVQ